MAPENLNLYNELKNVAEGFFSLKVKGMSRLMFASQQTSVSRTEKYY